MDPMIDVMTAILCAHPEIPVPRFMCLDRVDVNLGCDCDGYDHPVEYLDPPVTCLSTHRGPQSDD